MLATMARPASHDSVPVGMAFANARALDGERNDARAYTACLEIAVARRPS